jgi:hypothetical protein
MTDKQYRDRMRRLYDEMRAVTFQRFGYRTSPPIEVLNEIDGKVSRLIQLSRRQEPA